MNDFLEKASDYAFGELEHVNGDISKLSIPLQTIVVVYTAQGIIDNGGFQYFFESDFPNNPDYKLFSESYKRIGAKSAAENIDKAVALFGFENPHLNADKRQQYLETLDDEALFSKLGYAICGDESIWEKLNMYALSEQGAFAKT